MVQRSQPCVAALSARAALLVPGVGGPNAAYIAAFGGNIVRGEKTADGLEYRLAAGLALGSWTIPFVATKLCGMKDAAKHKRLARHSPTSSFAGVQLFGVLAGRVVSGAAVFNPSDFGGNDLARVGDLVVDFVLDPALWRDLNG
jgi:hypothetical protein